MPAILEGSYLTSSETARALQISKVRVVQLADSGKLPSTRTPLGRLFDVTEVEAFAAERAKRRS